MRGRIICEIWSFEKLLFVASNFNSYSIHKSQVTEIALKDFQVTLFFIWQYLTTVIPYEKKNGPPSVEDLQTLTKSEHVKFPSLMLSSFYFEPWLLQPANQLFLSLSPYGIYVNLHDF